MTSNPSSKGTLTQILLRAVPAALALSLLQGIVAIKFDLGVLYPLIGLWIGAIVYNHGSGLKHSNRQHLAVALTYLRSYSVHCFPSAAPSAST